MLAELNLIHVDELYPNQLCLPLSVTSHPETTCDRPSLIDQCLQVISLYISQDLGLSTPTIVTLPEGLSGGILQLGKTRLAIVVSQDLDQDELEVPSTWVNHSAWTADYYLAAQINLDRGWLRIWGYATHDDLAYDHDRQTYYVPTNQLIEDLNVLWVTEATVYHWGIQPEPNPVITPQSEPSLARSSQTKSPAAWREMLENWGWSVIQLFAEPELAIAKGSTDAPIAIRKTLNFQDQLLELKIQCQPVPVADPTSPSEIYTYSELSVVEAQSNLPANLSISISDDTKLLARKRSNGSVHCLQFPGVQFAIGEHLTIRLMTDDDRQTDPLCIAATVVAESPFLSFTA